MVYLLNRKFVFEAGAASEWVGSGSFFWGFVVAVWLDWLGWRADYAVGVGGDVCERGDDDGGCVDEFLSCGSLWCLNDENLDFELAGCAASAGGGG